MKARNGCVLLSAAASMSILFAGFAPADARAAEPVQSFAIAPQRLADALKQVSLASGVEIIAPAELLEGVEVHGVAGTMSAEDAIGHLLAGTGLVAERVRGVFVIRRQTLVTDTGGHAASDSKAIVVTGTRIQGAAIASPVTILSREGIRNTGQSSLGEAIRSVPQNFGGGQNPGIGFNVPSASGVDVGGASSLNLRGLGSDATLTLLNGHRLAYSASRQSIDVSAIPLDAVERVEIVADGASAIYGSDAVAGVANVILKRDYAGFGTRAQFGASTDGGNVQQLYGAIAGARWSSGGLFATYEFGRSTEISARERDYAATRVPGLTLYPALKHHSVVVGLHQEFAANLNLAIDGLYNSRVSSLVFPLNAAQTFTGATATSARSIAVAPSLKLGLGAWTLDLSAAHGEERTHFATDIFLSGLLLASTPGTYRNRSDWVELGGDGALVDLAGGPARLAMGLGYRSNHFSSFRGTGNIANVAASQDSRYAYAELNLPFVSRANGVGLIDHLSASAALRAERYPGVDSVVTPKFGLVYAPSEEFEAKASWGRSFRAPTFLQQYQLQQVLLVNAQSVGGSGIPAGRTALLVEGGNAALKPERATSWTATMVMRPRFIPGVRLELSYFDVAYKDRIVQPIPLIAQALTNPLYQSLVTLGPSDALKAATIAGAGQFVNAAGSAYDPATVIAIVDNRNRNAGRQSIRGVDLAASYLRGWGNGSHLNLQLGASYLKGGQGLIAGQATTPLAGIVFRPPHWRARASASWSDGGLTLTGVVTHSGGLDDTRFASIVRIDTMTMADLTARYRVTRGPAIVRGLDLVVSVQNLFNEKPGAISTTLPYETPYDSTNATPIGRMVSFGISKTW